MVTLLITILIFVAAGCDQRTSDEALQGKRAQSQSAAPSHSHGQSGAIEWSAPADWIEEHPASAMRQAQYRLPDPSGEGKDGEAVVFYFGGEGGSVQANLERWYGQFKQPDGRPSSEVAVVSTDTYNGLSHTIVDLTGTFLFSERMMGPVTEERPDYRMLADVIETPSGPWFVKVTGPDATLEHHKDNFFAFVRSFHTADT